MRSVEPAAIMAPEAADDLFALDEALDQSGRRRSRCQADLVKLRYFAGLTIPQAAELLGISPRKADCYVVLCPGLVATGNRGRS